MLFVCSYIKSDIDATLLLQRMAKFTFGLFFLSFLSAYIYADAPPLRSEAVNTFSTADNAASQPLEEIIDLHAQNLLAILNTKNYRSMNELLHKEAFIERLLSAISDDDRIKEEYRPGFSSAMMTTKISETLIQNIVAGGVRYMRHTIDGDSFRLLMRFNMGESGFDYLDFIFSQTPNQEYKIVDWYALSRGQLASTSIGAVSSLMLKPSENLFKRVLGLSDINHSVIDTFRVMMELFRDKKFSSAYEKYLTLPAEVRQHYVILTFGISLANFSQDDQAYIDLLNQLATHHGDKAEAAFLLIDHYFFAENWAGALRTIDAIEHSVGIDGMTSLLRANIYLSQEDAKNTILHAKKAVTIEPDMVDAYFSLALGYVMNRQYVLAVEAYDILINQHGYEFVKESFAEDDVYRDFIHSEPFKYWNIYTQ